MVYGEAFRDFINICVCVQQLAICTVYFSFIGENVVAVVRKIQIANDLVRTLFGSYNFVVLATLPSAVALALIRNLKILSPVTALASLLLAFAFGLIGETIAENLDYYDGGLPDINWPKV